MSGFSIPDKGEDFVNYWADRIKPLVVRNGMPCHINNKLDHFKQSFSMGVDNEDILEEAEGLVYVDKIETLHTFGYYGFFKPSVAEVIQQIPEELLGKVSYFVIDGPHDRYDLGRRMEELNAGFQVAKTTLYS